MTRKRSKPAPEFLMQDEPFHDSLPSPPQLPTEELLSSIALSDADLMFVVPTPRGEELVSSEWCERPTRELHLSEIRALLADAHPQRAATVRAIPAVRVA